MSDELRYFPSDIAAKVSISSSLTTVGKTDAIEFLDKINYHRTKNVNIA